MIDALNNLSILQFVVFALAVGTSLVALALLGALATHVNRIRIYWPTFAVALWILFFILTR